MAKLIVMVGLPGSGKSYYANKLHQEAVSPTVILSSDDYRKRLFGDENDQEHNDQVFKTLYADMRKYLISHIDVIFDATNTSLKARMRIINELRGIECEKEAYVICTPIERCVEQDAGRERKVGEEVIWKFVRSFQCPQTYEGFSKVVLVGLHFNYDCVALADLQDKMAHCDQNNPHHLFNLYEHCSRVAQNYELGSVEYWAGALHDVGKLFTRSTDESGISHYYNHDSVGAYYVLTHNEILPDASYILPVLHYVQYHMRAHNDFVGGKAEKKYRKLFGDQRFDQLIQFAEYDKMASGTYDKHEQLMKELKEDEE